MCDIHLIAKGQDFFDFLVSNVLAVSELDTTFLEPKHDFLTHFIGHVVVLFRLFDDQLAFRYSFKIVK